MSILPQSGLQVHSILNQFSINIPNGLSKEMEETILKFVWNSKDPQTAKAVLKKFMAYELKHTIGKTVSLINGTWKTGQLHALKKKRNWVTILYLLLFSR